MTAEAKAVAKESSFFIERDELLALLQDAVSPDYDARDENGYDRICKIVRVS